MTDRILTLVIRRLSTRARRSDGPVAAMCRAKIDELCNRYS